MSTYNRLLTGKHASAAALFTKLFPPPVRSNVSSIPRGLNTHHACHASAYEDFNQTSDVYHPRVCHNDFFPDMFIPVGPPRCMNMPHRSPNCPSMAAAAGGGESRKAWSAKENNECVAFRFEMPGLDKEKVKVWVEDETFFVKAEPVKENEEDEGAEGYEGRFNMPVGVYEMKEMKAEIKNGVLKVLVPKVKVEERKDVWEVEVK